MLLAVSLIVLPLGWTRDRTHHEATRAESSPMVAGNPASGIRPGARGNCSRAGRGMLEFGGCERRYPTGALPSVRTSWLRAPIKPIASCAHRQMACVPKLAAKTLAACVAASPSA